LDRVFKVASGKRELDREIISKLLELLIVRLPPVAWQLTRC
jgi:hypothetical protein